MTPHFFSIGRYWQGFAVRPACILCTYVVAHLIWQKNVLAKFSGESLSHDVEASQRQLMPLHDVAISLLNLAAKSNLNAAV